MVYFAGFAYSNQPISWVVVVGAACMTLPIHLIIYGLNDIADRESDSLNRRKGKTDGAVLQQQEVKGLVRYIILSAGLLFACLIGSGGYLAAAAFLLICAFAYSYSMKPLRLKSRPVLDSLSNGLWIYGIFLAGYWITQRGFVFEFPPATLAICIFLVPTAIHALATLLDRESDKTVGDRTIGIVFGKTYTTVFALILLSLCFALIGIENIFIGSYLLASIACIALTLRYRSSAFLRYILLAIIYSVSIPILLSAV